MPRETPAENTILHDPTPVQMFDYEIDDAKRQGERTWFRGETCNYWPRQDDMNDADAIRRHVLAGWTPPSPIITPQTRIVAFGSCFAEHVTNWLLQRKFNVLTGKDGAHGDAYIVRFAEGIVNTFVIRQQFEWAFENVVYDAELWHDYDAKAFGYDEDVRLKTRALLESADVFILTLGLSEIWYDEVTGGVFWRAVPEDRYDPSRHKFRVSSAAENKENLRAIYALIKKHRPEAKVILTLSPIPLLATFRPVSCITANTVSKAILRVAIDEAMREIDEPDSLYYWPSYDIVMDVFGDRWKPDRRHPKTPILDLVMLLFETTWCSGSTPEMSIAEAWVRARVATGALPRSFQKVLNGRYDQAEEVYSQLMKKDAGPHADLLLAYAESSGVPELVAWRATHP